MTVETSWLGVDLTAWHEPGHAVHRVKLTGFPRIPIHEGTLTIAGVVTAIGLTIVSLIGAILGGVLGMRFHRRVDKVSLT